jgi:hypothetical protein
MKNNEKPIDQNIHDHTEISEEQKAYIKKCSKNLWSLASEQSMEMKMTVRMQLLSPMKKDSLSARLFVAVLFLLLQKKKFKKVLYDGILNDPILLI